MKILVTGGAGFIGSCLVLTAVARGHTVINCDCLTYAGNLSSLSSLDGNKKHIFLRADIRDRDAMIFNLEQHRPDAVVNLAAESHVDRSIDGPGDFISTNINGTFTLLEAVRVYLGDMSEEEAARFRFLHVSTDEVFGSLGAEGYFSETTPYSPNSPYSASKAASDHIVRAWGSTYGVPAMVTNCSNNFGPRQFPEKLIPHMITSALAGRSLPVYGDGGNIRDWLYVEDHCDALLAVLERGRPGETYCIGGSNERTNIEIVRAICAILDDLRPRAEGSREGSIEFVKDRPGHDRRYAIDASKIRRELGWSPRHTFDAALRETVKWYLENERWVDDVISGGYRIERIGMGNNG